MVALWEAFYIENKRFDLDTLRVPNRSPIRFLKSNDFRGQSDDTGARDPYFRPILGVPGARAGLTHIRALTETPNKRDPQSRPISSGIMVSARRAGKLIVG